MGTPITPQQLFLLAELSGKTVANPNGRAASAAWLEPMQLRWVTEYQVDLNATDAAIRAGYSEKTARQMGSRLLGNPVVRSELQRQLEDRLRAAQLSFDGLLEQLRKLVYADVRAIFNEDDTIKSPKDWGDDIAVRVAGMDVEEMYLGKGDRRTLIGRVKKIKFYNPSDALNTIARYLELIAAGKGKPPEDGGGDYREKSDEELRQEALLLTARAADHAA